MKKSEPLGIEDYAISGFYYYNVNYNQSKVNEYVLTHDFIDDFISNNDFKELKNKKYKYKFINYGEDALVFVIKTEDGKYYTMLINQPSTKKGFLKEEYNNLIKLSYSDKVIKPLYYYENNDKELYITPYIYQARCISSYNNKYGIYVPEPNYHFESFNKDERRIVNTSMIANIIKLYNKEENLGIGDIKFTSGDFILQKEWSNEIVTLDSTLRNMKLITARKFVNIPIDKYIDILKKELTMITYYKNKYQKDDSILISQKLKVPMNKEEIEEGISLGLKLREN